MVNRHLSAEDKQFARELHQGHQTMDRVNERIDLELVSIGLEKYATFHGYPEHVFAHLQ